jgi:hypothetical protein
MAKYLAAYLFYTKDIPLVLGGNPDIQLTSYSDSSLATGPKRRSVSGQLTKLHPQAGAVHAKAKATQSTRASSFESELDALSESLKTLLYLETLLKTLNVHTNSPSKLYADNIAMINFVNGEGSLKNSRHMELRLWLIREHLARGGKRVEYLKGIIIPANFLTKLANAKEHLQFLTDIQGLSLIPQSVLKTMPSCSFLTSEDDDNNEEDRVEVEDHSQDDEEI